MLDYIKIKKNILNKRTNEEKSLLDKFFISLNPNEQKICQEIKRRELNEFAKEIGFELGSVVKHKHTNELFYVYSINDSSGMLDINYVKINISSNIHSGVELLRNSISLYNRQSVKEVPLYNIKENSFMDQYIKADIEFNNTQQAKFNI